MRPRLIWRLPLSIPLRNQGDGSEVSSAKRQSSYLSPPSQSDGSFLLRAVGSQWPADLFRDGPDCPVHVQLTSPSLSVSSCYLSRRSLFGVYSLKEIYSSIEDPIFPQTSRLCSCLFRGFRVKGTAYLMYVLQSKQVTFRVNL